jgi:predicted nucleic acid-binding protein
MILIDTSVWIDHFRTGAPALANLLAAGRALAHPFVIGELALGHLRQGHTILQLLHDLPQAKVATDSEALAFIEAQTLAGSGIGYSDVHLLASVRLTPGSALWTRDRALADAARRLGLGHEPDVSPRGA